jgi:hypothetical protein
MHSWVVGTVVLVALTVSSLMPLQGAWASTVQGTAIQLDGVDNINATVEQQARKGSGRTLATIIAMLGAASLLGGQMLIGLVGIGAGVGMGLLPGAVSSAFDAAPGATLVLTHAPQLLEAWWAPLLAALYPVLLAFRLLSGYVFAFYLALALVLVRTVQPWRRRAA